MSTSPLQGATAAEEAELEAAAGRHEPVGGWRNPGAGFLALLGLAAIGANMAVLVSAILTLSLKSAAIDPAHQTTILSIAVGVSGLFALIGYPVFGRLSDRTTSRLGRRKPFLLLGAALIGVGAVATLLGSTTLALTVAQVITTLGGTATIVAATSVIPDQFAPGRRGAPSALVGLSAPLGALLGLFIAQAVAPNLTLMILLPAGIGAIGIVSFALVLKDHRLDAADRPRFELVDFITTFWVSPLKHPNFAWAWWSRLLIFFGVAAVNAYQAFYLIIVQHIAPDQVASKIFLATLVLTVISMIFAPIAAKVSDRIGRRKPFVIVAAVIFAIGLGVVATADSYDQFLLAIAIVGLGQGVSFAVALALVTEVLPDPASAAKDLGIMNLANNLPSSIVPAVAPALLAIGASATQPQNFSALFLAGAVAGLIGAALIVPIRRVR
jgi:MFS family permease